MAQHQLFLADESISAEADCSSVWHKMLDWENWTSWETGMEKADFSGPIIQGSFGRVKLKSGPLVKLQITQINFEQSYVSEFHLAGTTFIFSHEIKKLNEKELLVHFAISATGWTALLMGNLLKKRMAATLHSSMACFQQQLSTLIP